MPPEFDRTGTRRRFLETTAASGLVTGLVGAGTVSAQSDPGAHVAWECDHVTLTDTGPLERARVDFQDESYVQSANGISPPDGEEPVRLGSPGRTIETVTVGFSDGSETTLENPEQDCRRRRLATDFTATSVFVPPAEFALSASIPSVLTTSVTLHFVDGSSQRKQHYSDDGAGNVDDFPEISGLKDTFGMDAVASKYRGTGPQDGKTIEAIEINTDEGYRTHYLKSDCAEDCQYGAGSAQERIIEVVGTSEGAVYYELTARGPIEPVDVNGRIKSEDNDDVVDNGDGTWTVEGFTGNTGFGDSFVVNGEITSFEQTDGPGDYVVRSMERRLLDY